MIPTVLADDEVLARQKLRQLLRDEREIEVVGEGMTAAETIDLVRATRPQLLFLDIQMPGMDGFDIATELCSGKIEPAPHIIFTTAHDQYALRAFEIHAIDYLLKPFTRERLSSAVERARKVISLGNQQMTAGSSASRNGNRYTTRIVFKSRGRIVFLPVSDIRWISAEENYVRISTQGESHLLRETMAHLEEKLDPEMFLRVHRSSIVNLQHVKEVRTETDGEYAVVLVNGEKLTMSRGYRSRINEWLTHS
ncbi:MAG TPA: LytTR family DNA-binding domain-containing protein [Edaphobacter sp.]|nr:LytTR family DNA-binding domain-containing protein [Edaphobacter sp.]